MSMAFGFRVPVYPKISGSTSAKSVLNNLVRNPYAGGLLITPTNAAKNIITASPWNARIKPSDASPLAVVEPGPTASLPKTN